MPKFFKTLASVPQTLAKPGERVIRATKSLFIISAVIHVNLKITVEVNIEVKVEGSVEKHDDQKSDWRVSKPKPTGQLICPFPSCISTR